MRWRTSAARTPTSSPGHRPAARRRRGLRARGVRARRLPRARHRQRRRRRRAPSRSPRRCEPGTIVRIHARDSVSADADLRRSLGLRAEALGSGGAAGALMFSCNGRGRRLFGVRDHDATRARRDARRRPGGRVLRRRRDRPGRRRGLPARLHGHCGSVRRMTARRRLAGTSCGSPRERLGRPSCSPARAAASATRSPARCTARAPSSSSPAGAPTSSRRSPPETGGRALAVDLTDRDAVARLAAEAGRRRRARRQRGAAGVAATSRASTSSRSTARSTSTCARRSCWRARSASAMAARGAGHLVFVTSLSGKRGAPGTSLYSATKFGLRGFAQGAARGPARRAASASGP